MKITFYLQHPIWLSFENGYIPPPLSSQGVVCHCFEWCIQTLVACGSSFIPQGRGMYLCMYVIFIMAMQTTLSLMDRLNPRKLHTLLGQCWTSVADDGPTSNQHCVRVSCCLGNGIHPPPNINNNRLMAGIS